MKISRARVRGILQRMRGLRLAVVGDWMLDRYVWGAASRLSPEAAVPVVEFAGESESLGGAGNVAANLAALGARVVPFGVTGGDDPGLELARAVRALGMPDKGLLQEASRQTTQKTRIIARHQQVVRVDRETRAALTSEIAERLIRRVLSALRQVDALVLSDYDKGTVTDELADRVLGACRRLGKPAFVKPKWSRLPTYGGATAIVCNRAEASFLVTRALRDEGAIEQAGRALLAHFRCPAVIITRGEQGLSLFEHDSPKVLHLPATCRESSYAVNPIRVKRSERAGRPGGSVTQGGRQVFDVTGAGDTVLAALALACAAGASFADAAALANAAAGVVVGKLGTATLTPGELLAAVADSH